MNLLDPHWEHIVLDAVPPLVEICSTGVGDIDGDGRQDIVMGGRGELFWYRPATGERGVIGEGHFHVGVILEDIDGDGRQEVVVAREIGTTDTWDIAWYKAAPDLSSWERHVLDPLAHGGAHDLCFADIDGDGEKELITIAVYCPIPGVFIYKRSSELTAHWQRFTVQEGIAEEGLAVADLDGDGKLEIINGPDWFTPPNAGPYSGPWERHIFAPSFREMCRVSLLDVTGSGVPDIFLTDSEYMDGRLSWFENRLREDPAHPWIEHPIDTGLIYSHSLQAWHDESGLIHLFTAEMGQGGWDAPRNFQARLLEYTSRDGREWKSSLISLGEGVHEARAVDIDDDGEMEIIGHDAFERPFGENASPRVLMWKRASEVSPLATYQHRFLDRDKPITGVEIIAVDIDGDGQRDVACGSWWYHLPTGKRYDIPGIYQVINAYDLDGDGRQEIIAMEENPVGRDWYMKLSPRLCWIKPIDPQQGIWEKFAIGQGHGDWPHGSLVAPLLPGGQLALVTGYHNARQSLDHPVYPEIFTIPTDPRQGPWEKHVLAEIPYGEELTAVDLDNNGKLDIVAGSYWLENLGNGCFATHVITEAMCPARQGIMDVNGDGRLDIVLGEEVFDYDKRIVPRSRLAWFEQPEDPRQTPWPMHVIDMVRCAHSVGAADLDGDGEMEIICGEHDPFWEYRQHCRLLVYKKNDPDGQTWKQYALDHRFEHHDGTKIIQLEDGRTGILSHGWVDRLYVHLWEPGK